MTKSFDQLGERGRSRVADLAFDFQPFDEAELGRPVTIDTAHDPSSICMAYDQSE